jgi:hypothetical protein
MGRALLCAVESETNPGLDRVEPFTEHRHLNFLQSAERSRALRSLLVVKPHETDGGAVGGMNDRHLAHALPVLLRAPVREQ